MQPRTTAVLFAIALALGAFVWFYEIQGEAGRREAEAREKQLFPGVEAKDVEWIALRTSDGRDVRLERRGEAWQVVKPIDFPADRFGVDAIASALAEMSSEAVYEKPQEASVYGLDDAAHEVRFGADGTQHTLRTGDATPLGSNSYVSVVGEKPVYTVPTFRINALRKSFDDLRDKRILEFDAASVQRLTASWPGGRAVLARSDGGWKLEAPIAGDADSETVDDLLSNLSYLRAASFADDPLPDSETGLDAPAFSAVLELAPAGEEGSEGHRLSFAVGASDKDGKRYVRADRPTLFLIRKERLDDFPRKLSDYRFKQLAKFPATDAKRLELIFPVEKGAASEVVTVTAVRDGDRWSVQGENLDPDKVGRLVGQLSHLQASEVLADEAGPDELAGLELDPPNASVRVFAEAEAKADEKPLADLRIGALHGSKGIVAQRADRPEVFRLDPAVAEHLPVSLEALRNRFLKAPAPQAPAAAAAPDTANEPDEAPDGSP